MVYWFTSKNRVVESKMLHRLLMVWDGVVGDRTPGTLIELTSPLIGHNRKAVSEVQEAFAQLLAPFFPKMTMEVGGRNVLSMDPVRTNHAVTG